ncbi:tetratricopeptide repeat protein [Zavarzinia sp.]|uniref:tetratricopeptide repeat protein n=1 Tax=Zavarzinia sp. TaxID=2027920 RepID=UPI003566735B
MKNGSKLRRGGRGRLAVVGLVAGLLVSGCSATSSATTEAGDAASLDTIEVHSLTGAYLSARQAGGQQDASAAALFYAAALRLDPGNGDLRRQSMMASLLVGNYVDAAAQAEIVARLEREDQVAPILAGIAALRVGRYQDAVDRLGKPRQSTRGLDITPLIAAWALQGLGKTDEAFARLASIGSEPVLQSLILFNRALIAEAADRLDVARDAYAALLKAPGGVTVRTVLAEGAFLERRGEKAGARALYQAALSGGGNRTIAAALARLDRGEAPTPLVSTPAEGVAEAMYSIASLLSLESANEPVLVYLRMALMARPDFPEAQALLADAFEKVGDKAQAAELYRTMPADSPLRAASEIRYALLLADGGQSDAALALLNQRIAAKADDLDALVAKADVLRQREDFAAAADAYGAAIAVLGEPDPSSWSLFFSRGICLERTKQWGRAETDLLKALELRPDQPSVLNYLAYSWVEQGRNLKRAETMLVKAAADRPDDGYIVDSLGWVFFRQGRFAEAVTQLEKAVALKPGDPTINDHLGDAYWAVGRKLEAEFQWRTALALKPAEDEKAVIEEKLEKGLPPERLVPGAD